MALNGQLELKCVTIDWKLELKFVAIGVQAVTIGVQAVTIGVQAVTIGAQAVTIDVHVVTIDVQVFEFNEVLVLVQDSRS